jgi:hypothetical protein
MRFVATLMGPEVLPFPLFRFIGRGSHFSGCLPLMEDTVMLVQCGIVLHSIACFFLTRSSRLNLPMGSNED